MSFTDYDVFDFYLRKYISLYGMVYIYLGITRYKK